MASWAETPEAFAGFGASELLEKVVVPVCEVQGLVLDLYVCFWEGENPSALKELSLPIALTLGCTLPKKTDAA